MGGDYKGRWVAKLGRWEAKLVALLVRIPEISQKYKMGDISNGLASTLSLPKNIQNNSLLYECKNYFLCGAVGCPVTSFLWTLHIYMYSLLTIKTCHLWAVCLILFLFVSYWFTLLRAINLVEGFTPFAVFLEIRYPS